MMESVQNNMSAPNEIVTRRSGIAAEVEYEQGITTEPNDSTKFEDDDDHEEIHFPSAGEKIWQVFYGFSI